MLSPLKLAYLEHTAQIYICIQFHKQLYLVTMSVNLQVRFSNVKTTLRDLGVQIHASLNFALIFTKQ